MNPFKYKSILYFISLVILATLCIQVYWTYKNYQAGKQQLINDVQTSLDNAVDQYFTELATKSPFRTIMDTVNLGQSIQIQGNNILKFGDSVWTHRDSNRRFPESMTILQSFTSDSIDFNIAIIDSSSIEKANNSIFEFIRSSKNPITELSSKIIISISEDRLSLSKVDSLFTSELNRKNIAVDYGLSYKETFEKNDTLRADIIRKATMETTSKSPYFFHNNSLKAHFTNVTLAVLKKNLLGIFLSFVLVASVIFCLLYLLKIIKQQKQLAEVKNDLISNITHEFKTPIATIGIAMEAIQKFNAENDSEKNLRYAKISGEQVDKLNMMVEKLLETATLDSEKLQLNFEPNNLVELLRKASQKEAFSVGNKTITFSTSEEEIYFPIDIFHFENAINNIVDNAIKYGGEDISVKIKKDKDRIHISINDSGNSLTEAQKKQIFEKFYRVPKGNTHDEKGFGIGLYYSKKIIEKHKGSISLSIKPNTQFNISLPHG
ncbi:MAG: HAMP domain-containing histidine kinase [Flavobacteriaceae bacterium]|nr:HAMP domain-containing histidine kinase [Flavobacteriaceae bacterium]